MTGMEEGENAGRSAPSACRRVLRKRRAMAELLTISEAAAVARCSAKTIRRAIHDRCKPLRAYRPGRAVVIAATDLDSWIRSRVVTPSPHTVRDRLSPTARELLDGLLDADSAPQRHPRRNRANKDSAKPSTYGTGPSDCDSVAKKNGQSSLSVDGQEQPEGRTP